jgi:phage anti-repressor protein/DNA-directed RNA polymerase subunit H (RpoH/RPB5)
MLKINENNMIGGLEIHKAIKSKTKRFDIWVKRRIEEADLKEGKDFRTNLCKSTGGRQAIEYEFTIDAAKEVCLLERNSEGKKLRQWLIGLSNQVDNARLLSPEQVMQIVRMIKVFSIYEYRKLALEKNQDHYIKNALMLKPSLEKNKSLLYSSFHKWRNEVLNLGKEELEKRVLDYCIIEQRRLPKFKNKDEMLTFLGQHEMIKNAIWDLLSSQNKSEEMINNICNLAAELAKEMKPFLERLNQSNLFFERIEETTIKSIL